MLAACAATPELGRRHAPSDAEVPLPGADFDAYVTEARAQIAAALEVAGPPPTPELIEDRGPFELVPDDGRCAQTADGIWPKAALLIHPVGATPYVVRDLGARLVEDCHLVRAILLPGHGTLPGDLLGVDGEAWLTAVRRGIASFSGVAERVDLVGVSTGSTLALRVARSGEPPDGPGLGALVLISPVIEPPKPLIDGDPLAWLAGGLAGGPRWARVEADLDPVAYDSLPETATREVDRLARAVAADAGLVERPVFVAVSATDAEIDAGRVRRWFCRQLVGPRWLVWYAPDAAPITDCRFAEARSSDAAPGVLDHAHTALPVAPDNARYGWDGGFVDCRHYAAMTDSPLWLLCADRSLTPANSKVRYGEVRPANLERAILRRLTFNPDFEGLADTMLAFLDDLGEAPWPPPPRPATSE